MQNTKCIPSHSGTQVPSFIFDGRLSFLVFLNIFVTPLPHQMTHINPSIDLVWTLISRFLAQEPEKMGILQKLQLPENVQPFAQMTFKDLFS